MSYPIPEAQASTDPNAILLTVLGDTSSQIDELLKKTGTAIAADNRVYMNPKEVDAQMMLTQIGFNLLRAKQAILEYRKLAYSRE